MCAGLDLGVATAFMSFVLLAVLLVAALLAVRRLVGVNAPGVPTPARAVLDHRLAMGEISVEDYMERESLLRSPVIRARRTPLL